MQCTWQALQQGQTADGPVTFLLMLCKHIPYTRYCTCPILRKRGCKSGSIRMAQQVSIVRQQL
jgi:hypothetical protein